MKSAYGAGMTGNGSEWWLVDGVATAWFAAASLNQGAALAGHIVGLPVAADVDVRPTGVRVRLDSDEHAALLSAAARRLGLTPDPAVLQQLRVVIESSEPTGVRQFWQRILAYEPGPDGRLTDPQRRDPPLRISESTESRPLRNRIHLDIVRPATSVAQVGLGDGSGPYGVRHSDPDGNEADVVPAGALGDRDEIADWQAVFSAMACYRTSSPAQQRDLVAAAADLADDAGFPLLVDLRPGLVILDSGKDLWERDAHGLDIEFDDLAAAVQAAARSVGAVADAELPRFTQLFLDAADVAAVRAFWTGALGYVPDRRSGVTDLIDPRRLNPVLVFQPLDVSDTERRRQRNRIHVELAVPEDVGAARLETIVDAGGTLLDGMDGRWQLADPEGNELVLIAGS
jgi:hypothetical protein